MKPPPPFDLRCEYMRDPLGVDVPRPRLSWLLDHPEKYQVQKSYRILVSSKTDRAAQAMGDIWDSGKIDSSERHLVPYDGSPLQSGQVCFWRVQWWDKQYRSSDFSPVARFELGLLGQEDWSAHWISKKVCAEFTSKGTVLLGEFLGDYVNTYACYLRNTFALAGRVASARAYVCGLGNYELSINGSRVGDRVLDPAQTDFRKVSLYSTYDVTEALAEASSKNGQAKFAVGIILGNGRHIRNYGYDYPKAIVQIKVRYDDGTSATFVSDRTWRVSHGPLQENGLYFGERYDARKEMPGWDQPDFDDSGWETATEVNGYPLASQVLPPIRVVQTFKPTIVSKPDALSRIYDCGQNFAGWVRLTVRGERGTEIRMRHSELLHEDGSLNVSPNQNAEATDVYVLRGGRPESYEPRFTYHGFRYCELSGTPSLPEILSLDGCMVHSDVEPVGTFRCSNQVLNKVHDNIRMGQLSNLMSIPTDCAQRDERHGWLGDAHLVAEESMFNFDMASFHKKFLVDIRHAQREDGSLPDVVPPYTGRLYPADPAWSSAYITIAWYHYSMYGDENVLEEHYDSMRMYLEFLKKNADGQIIRGLGKYGDWCPPGSIAPKRTPVDLTATWYYYHDALLLGRIAHALHREDDHEELQNLALGILKAFNEEFLRGGEYKANKFAPVDRSPGQTSNVLPLYLKMVPPENRQHVLESLLRSVIDEQDYHLDTGILGTRYLLDVLTEAGHVDVAYKVASQRSYPGWGYMVEEGATTLWERWENITGGGMNSHNHVMFGSVDAWFYRVLAGISCREPGWSNIAIKPFLIEGLSSAEAEVRTVKGCLKVSWSRGATYMSLSFTIPVGCSGQVFVPKAWDNPIVEEGGEVIWRDDAPPRVDNDHGCFVAADQNHLHFVFGSGDYAVTIKPGQQIGGK